MSHGPHPNLTESDRILSAWPLGNHGSDVTVAIRKGSPCFCCAEQRALQVRKPVPIHFRNHVDGLSSATVSSGTSDRKMTDRGQVPVDLHSLLILLATRTSSLARRFASGI